MWRVLGDKAVYCWTSVKKNTEMKRRQPTGIQSACNTLAPGFDTTTIVAVGITDDRQTKNIIKTDTTQIDIKSVVSWKIEIHTACSRGVPCVALIRKRYSAMIRAFYLNQRSYPHILAHTHQQPANSHHQNIPPLIQPTLLYTPPLFLRLPCLPSKSLSFPFLSFSYPDPRS